MNRYLKLNFLTNGLNTFICAYQFTKVSTLRCQTVNKDIKFDCNIIFAKILKVF